MKIISGGQTGVDRGAHDAALELGLEHGGYCPRGRRAEDGVIPAKYVLTEAYSRHYRERTHANVIAADAVLVIGANYSGPGTDLTIRLAHEHDRRLLPIYGLYDHDPDAHDPCRGIQDFLVEHTPRVLLVAGPRESRAPGAQDATRRLLVEALRPYASAKVDASTTTT